MSIFDSLSRKRGASLLKVAFAEKKPITCTLPNGKPLELVGVIVGGMKTEERVDSSGNVISVETCFLDVQTDQFGDVEFPLSVKTVFQIDKFPGARFNVDEQGSDYGAVISRISVSRSPLASRNDKRDRNG